MPFNEQKGNLKKNNKKNKTMLFYILLRKEESSLKTNLVEVLDFLFLFFLQKRIVLTLAIKSASFSLCIIVYSLPHNVTVFHTFWISLFYYLGGTV